MTSQQHRQPVSTEVVTLFRNQNSTTFPEDHCCIIICRLRGLGSSITIHRRSQYSEVDSGFHFVFLV